MGLPVALGHSSRAGGPTATLRVITILLRQPFQSRAALAAENLGLRQQIAILQRSVKRSTAGELVDLCTAGDRAGGGRMYQRRPPAHRQHHQHWRDDDVREEGLLVILSDKSARLV